MDFLLFFLATTFFFHSFLLQFLILRSKAHVQYTYRKSDVFSVEVMFLLLFTWHSDQIFDTKYYKKNFDNVNIQLW